MNLVNNFNLDKSIAGKYFLNYDNTIDIIPDIKNVILEIIPTLGDDFSCIGDNVWVNKSASIAKTSCITGPCIIDCGAEIRHSAYIRGNVIVGKNTVVGNSVELKNCLLFDNVQVPHFNYIGDSILGYKAHFGAGAITSNVKSDKTNITIRKEDSAINTNLKKMGAIVCDMVEIGCNSVLCPGTILCKNTTVYPLTCVRGYVDRNTIVKNNLEVIKKNIIYIDFDSTIYNSNECFSDILKVFDEYGIDKSIVQELIKQLFNNNDYDANVKINHFNIDILIETIKKEFDVDQSMIKKIHDVILSGSKYVYDDVSYFIKNAHAKKYQVVVLSYGDKENQLRKINGSKIDEIVDDVIISEDFKFNIDYIDYASSIFIDDNPNEIQGFINKGAGKVVRIKRTGSKFYNYIINEENVVEITSLLDLNI